MPSGKASGPVAGSRARPYPALGRQLDPGRVYFDHNATSPPDPRVVEAMLPWLLERHGNPSSLHAFGQVARAAVEEARERIASLLGAQPLEVVFVASGTEANNLVLHSVALGGALGCGPTGHLVVSALEHPSVLETAKLFKAAGMQVERIAPRPNGVVDPDELEGALRPDTRLVALMLANNELGTIQPVAEVGRRCRARGVPVLCDAVQAAGKIAVDVNELEVDYLSLGAHKFHGPLGAGALYVRSGQELHPLIVGGSQERRRRAGTENVAALVGFGMAAELARRELAERACHLAGLRDAFEAGLLRIPDARVHCTDAPRLPHTSHVAFLGTEGEALLIRLDLAGFAVSTGSACASGTLEPSPTLLALGLDPHEALASIRISFGMSNQAAEVEAFLPVLEHEVAELRRLVGAQ